MAQTKIMDCSFILGWKSQSADPNVDLPHFTLLPKFTLGAGGAVLGDAV